MAEIDYGTFPDRARASRPFVLAVAARKVARGYGVFVPPLEIRPSYEVHEQYTDRGDIFAWVSGSHEIRRIEVTGRPNTDKFHDRDSYPWTQVIVQECATAEKWDPLPAEMWNVSADMLGALVVDVQKTRPLWVRKTTRNRKRRDGAECDFWFLQREAWTFVPLAPPPAHWLEADQGRPIWAVPTPGKP